jgi:hypothetical protein
MNLGRIVAALRRQPLLADVILAVALAALAAISGVVLVAPRAQVEPPSTPVIVAWAVALAAPLLLRRRWPLVVLAVTTVHFTRYWAVGQVNEIASWVILGVAVYSAACSATVSSRSTLPTSSPRPRWAKQRKVRRSCQPSTGTLEPISRNQPVKHQPDRHTDGHAGPCQRFARNCATRNLTPPQYSALDSTFHLHGCVVTWGPAW